MQGRGPAVGRELARVDPPLELLRAAAAEERRLAAILREPAVEEDGQLELGADPVGQGERRLARGRLVLGPQRDERDDVRGADPRVRSLVLAQVDPLRRRGDSREQRLDELVPRAHEREDGAVVVPVRVDVEQPPRPGKRLLERGDDLRVAALGEVRHGFERKAIGAG